MPPFPASALSFSRNNVAAFSFPTPITPVPSLPLRSKALPAKTIEQALDMLHDAEHVIAQQAERIRQLENLALTDELTGLSNRRGFMAALRHELAAARRNKKNAGLLLMVDLDQFKQINDRYGHSVGDAYLQTAASVLLNEVRVCDYVARIGGDEFAILLTQIGPKDGAMRLKRLEEIFNKRMMHSRECSIPLRGSFGFAVLGETETPRSLLIAADMKLYASKAQRRKAAKEEMQ